MSGDWYNRNPTVESAPMFTIGGKLTMWIVLVFVAVLLLFVGLDLVHESRFAVELGATPEQLAALRTKTAWLHLVHLVVTVLAFALAIHILVRRVLIRRIKKIILAVNHFRMGLWTVRIPTESKDEIDWLIQAIRKLGPDLERKLATFIEVDRKVTIARLNGMYDRRLGPPARSIIDGMRTVQSGKNGEKVWCEAEQCAMRIIAELGRLGRPDHPDMSGVVAMNHGGEIFKQVASSLAGQQGE